MMLTRTTTMARLFCACLALAAASFAEVTVQVDAREAQGRIFHVVQEFPVSAGNFSLDYPKWIPGEHAPSGPITNIVGLRLTAEGAEVPWRRDDADLFRLHCRVPQGAQTLTAAFDYVAPADASGQFTASPNTTAVLAVIDWHIMLLYPAGASPATLRVRPSIHLPEGWSWGGALLAGPSQNAALIELAPVSLETLIDTPIVIGQYHRAYTLREADGARPKHVLDIVADSKWAMDPPQSRLDQYGKLVDEELAIFGNAHYPRYHFLLTLTDYGATFGLEHHMTSDNREAERFLVDDDLHRASADLLPHEMFHSWNAKTFRPAPMIARDYQRPIDTSMLWIYEGLTDYYGNVLAVRSGLRTPEEGRDGVALFAATLENTRGRTWRPLEDTATAARDLYASPRAWRFWRRGTDFYPEGDLLWLEADAIIREHTAGAKSLDDFCKAFYGRGGAGKVFVQGYSERELYAALDQIAPHDWTGFFDQRLRRTNEHAPLGGVQRSGWRLAYTDKENTVVPPDATIAALYSLGAIIDDEGTVLDVVPGMPIQNAGIAPGMKVIAVDGRGFTPDLLEKAIESTKEAERSLELIVENSSYFKMHNVDYQGGMRYPHLERDESTPDLLSAIFAPRTAPPQQPSPK